MVNAIYVLMLPYTQELSNETRDRMNELSGLKKKVWGDRLEEGLWVNKGHLTLITEEKICTKKLDKLVEKYGVNAILVGRQSSNTAFLHTGAEKDLPRLWSIIYFEWNEKWSLHQ